MKYSLLALPLLLAVSANAWVTKPWFCHDIDCPQYVSVRNTSTYEVRTYNTSQWMTNTVTSDPNYDSAVKSSFMKLFGYISGANTLKKKIPMTAPVLSLINTTAEPGPFCAAAITVGFYLPVGGPPATNPSLSGLTLKPQTYAVASYGGYATNATVVKHAAALAAQLESDGVKFNAELVGAASYDAPFRIFGRHNEVWLMIEN